MLSSPLRFILLLWLLLITACASQPQQSSLTLETDHGLLWKIESPGNQSSYLFGTIHSEDPRVLDIPSPVLTVFDQAQILALEIEFSRESGQYAMASMFFSDGRTLDKLIDQEMAQQVIKLMSKRGLPEHQIMLMKPWAVFTLMNMPEPETGIYLDIKLYQEAVKQGKQLAGLETIQEQIATFDEMNMDDQLSLLKYSLDNEEEFSKALDQTIDIYLNRDLKAMEDLNNEFMQNMPEALATLFIHRLIDHRNHRMYRRMQPLLKSGNAFVAVGALHLPGKTGLLSLLRANGYAVQRIY